MLYEETIHLDENCGDRQYTCPEPQTRAPKPWKKIVIGGTTGILMGAGGTVTALSYAARNDVEEAEDLLITGDDDHMSVMEVDADDAEVIDVPEVLAENSGTLEVDVAYVTDDMTFGEAFAEARKQVGAGGVFEWRDGLFNTYYEEEWDAMDAQSKADFAQMVSATIDPDEMDYESMFADVYDDESELVDDNIDLLGSDDEVRILGIDEYDAHAVPILDVDADDDADFAIIDMDDNYELSADDVVVFPDGQILSIDELLTEIGEMDDANMDSYGGDQFIHNLDVEDIVPDDVDDSLIDV